MNINCNWEFVDYDKNKKFAYTGIALFVFVVIFYLILVCFGPVPKARMNIAVWLFVLSVGLYIISKTPSFTWKSTPVTISAFENELLFCAYESAKESGTILDCRYTFAPYKVDIIRDCGENVFLIEGASVLDYLDGETVVKTEKYPKKSLIVKPLGNGISSFREYFHL